MTQTQPDADVGEGEAIHFAVTGDVAYLVSGLTGQLLVYDLDGNRVATKTLTLSEDASGQVWATAPALTLNQSTSYIFVLIYSYNGSPVAVAYVEFITGTSDAQAVEYAESDIYDDPEELAAASIADFIVDGGILPDLDADGDGISNLDEVLAPPVETQTETQSGTGSGTFSDTDVDTQTATSSDTDIGTVTSTATETLTDSQTETAIDDDVDDDGYRNTVDCDDTNANVYPGRTEVCDDGVDQDCNGSDASCAGQPNYDDDGDGLTDQNGDCDDSNPAIYPGATETCNGVDDDCDDETDEGVQSIYYRDGDSDGFGSTTSTSACSVPSGYVSNDDDCDDTAGSVYPDASETCNSLNDDCDTATDEGVTTTYYRDADSDLYGTTATTTSACSAPTGYVSNSSDCNDTSSSVNPGASESCNSINDDCDTATDEGVTTTYYRDADTDSYGGTSTSTQACSLPSGYSTNNTDCNDASSSVNPGASESCNSINDDCDTATDEGVTTTYYRDADTDSYGGTSTSTQACSLPSGYSTNNTDCDDAAASVHPGATESCNGVNDDCDTATDEGVTTTYYRDADTDSYGGTSTSTQACSLPSGYSINNTDCNDALASVNPGATESCNGVNDDCDTATDEGVTTTYYRDADTDSYGGTSTSTQACSQPSGYVDNSADCNDASSAVRPGAFEICGDSSDQDCNDDNDRSDNLICPNLADVSITGAEAGDRYGICVFGGVDLDNDGYDDWGVGADYGSLDATYSDVGVVETFAGSAGLADLTPTLLIYGSSSGYRTGLSFSFAGGFTSNLSDGDLVIGAPGLNSGKTVIFWDGNDNFAADGSTAELYVNNADEIYTGDLTGEALGYSVAFTGDTNEDGYDDLLAASYGDGAGEVHFLYGGGSRTRIEDTIDANEDFVLVGESTSDQAGYAVAGAGDTNGDGCADMIIGAPNALVVSSRRGKAYVVQGRGSGCSVTSGFSASTSLSFFAALKGATATDLAGYAVAGIGDIDNDGYDDVAVGVPGYDGGGSSAGAVVVFFGSSSGISTASISSAPLIIVGENSGDALGISVAPAGDIDGDGYADFIIGAQSDDTQGSNTGAAYLIYGGDRTGLSGTFDLSDLGSLLSGIKFPGAAAGDEFGTSVYTVGDADGDGKDDIIIGAPYNDDAGAAAGKVYIFTGETLSP